MWDTLTLGTCENVYDKGLEALTREALDAVKMLEVRPALDVLTQPQDPPTVFFCYRLHDLDGKVEEPWPRLRKQVLKQLRYHGRDVRSRLVVIDIDLKDQADLSTAPRTEEGKVRWSEQAETWAATILARGQATLVHLGLTEALRYRTTHGLRIVYVLETELKAEDQEKATAAVIGAWARCGVTVDKKCRDWTRAFFGPKPGALIERPAEVPLVTAAALADLPAVESMGLVASQAPETPPASVDQAVVTKLRDELRSANYSTLLFSDEQIPMGRRDSTLFSLVRTAVNRARRIGAGPEHVLEVLSPLVDRIEAGPGEDWGQVLWEKIRRVWAGGYVEADMAPDKIIQEATRKATFEVQRVRNATSISELAEKVALWCPDPQLRSIDPAQVRAALTGRLLCYYDGLFHVLRPDTGDYSRQPVEFPTYSPVFFQVLDLLAHDRGEVEGWQGKRRFVETFCCLNGELDIRKTVFGFRGVRVEGTTMIVGAIELALPEPKFVPEVDEWLRLLDPTGYVTAWLAAALAVDEGRVPALYLHGATGTGKTLLANGLAACFAGGFEMPVDGGNLLATFNEALAGSPIVHFEEGIGQNTARQFRSLVGARGLEVRAKYQRASRLDMPHRVIISANNRESIVRCLEKNSTEDDRRAVMRRISMVETTEPAARFLLSQNLPAWLPQDRPRTGLLPQHLSWIYQRRQQILEPFVDPGNKTLLIGTLKQEEIAEQLFTASESQRFEEPSREVFQTFLLGLEAICEDTPLPGAQRGWDFIAFDPQGFPILQVGAWRNKALVQGQRDERRQDTSVSALLRRLSSGGLRKAVGARDGLSGTRSDRRATWTTLSRSVLDVLAQQHAPAFWALMSQHSPDRVPDHLKTPTDGEA